MKSCFLKKILYLKQEQMSIGYELVFPLSDICSCFIRQLKFILSLKKQDLSYVVLLMYLDLIFRQKSVLPIHLHIDVLCSI